MRRGSLVEQWRQSVFAIRALAHVGAAAEASRGRPMRIRVGVLAASLAGDAAIATRAGTPHRDRRVELAVNTIDACVGVAVARYAPFFARASVVATVVPTAIETGFRLGAGTRAVPVLEPSMEWTPCWDPPLARLLSLPWGRAFTGDGPLRHLRQELGEGLPRPVPSAMVRFVVEVGKDSALPLAAMAFVRRAQGRRLGFGPLGWVSFAALGGYALARSRDDAQRATRALWDERTTSIVEEARVGSRVMAALSHNQANEDPKSLLLALGAGGSARARAAYEQLQARSNDVVRTVRSRGTFLRQAAAMDVDPPAAGMHWLANSQVRELRMCLEAIDDSTADGCDSNRCDDSDGDVLRVITSTPTDTVLEYRGRRIELHRAEPEMVFRLDPTVPSMLLGISWTVLSLLPQLGGAPLGPIAASTAIQGWAVARIVARPSTERRADTTTAIAVGLATVIADVGIGLRQRRLVGRDGSPIAPGTGASMALGLLLATNWAELREVRVPLVALTGAAWAFALRRPGPRPAGTVLAEMAFLVMPALATATVGSDVRREVLSLDARLDDELESRIDGVSRAEAADELSRFIEGFEAVIDELDGLRGQLDDDDIERIRTNFRSEVERLRSIDPMEVIH